MKVVLLLNTAEGEMLTENLPFKVTICRLQKHVEKLRQASLYLNAVCLNCGIAVTG